MWFTYLKALGLTAVQGLLSVDSMPHPEKPEAAVNKPSIVATAKLDAPITAYEIRYGIAPRSSDSANRTS